MRWVCNGGDHQRLFTAALKERGNDPKVAFRSLFDAMKVKRFGRTAKFDYLAMIGKLGLAKIEPDSPYFESRSGPTAGARLLFGGSKDASLSRSTLEKLARDLDTGLQIGMQAIEDALCNWQKAPDHFKAFRG